ncbi:MAG: hypothetical protein HQ559_02655 [Lentisphaerae bacterium]|nr:hypothetical protein [Lentisphaerota bacterium]
MAGNLGPTAELAYCFEALDVGGEDGQLAVNICVDQERWPGFDGIGTDRIEVQIWRGTNFLASVVWPFGIGSVNGAWCYNYGVSVSPGEFTIRARLIIDGVEVCDDEAIGTVSGE